LYADPSGYIFAWLIGYSALLGPIGGIMIADYFVYRRRQLNVAALYQPEGEYSYTGGFSGVALIALALSILPNLPGFLATIKVPPPNSVAPIFLSIYRYAWFVGFALAFGLYLLLRGIADSRTPQKLSS